MKLQSGKSASGILLGLALFGFAGLNAPANARHDAADPAKDRNSDAALELRKKVFDRKPIERVDPQEQPALAGEVPDDLLMKIHADLKTRTGGSQSDFELVRTEAVRWNDGGLGCAEPRMTYQQVPVDGYWVVIAYQGKKYDYRASDRGFFKLCPGPSLTR